MSDPRGDVPVAVPPDHAVSAGSRQPSHPYDELAVNGDGDDGDDDDDDDDDGDDDDEVRLDDTTHRVHDDVSID